MSYRDKEKQRETWRRCKQRQRLREKSEKQPSLPMGFDLIPPTIPEELTKRRRVLNGSR